MFEKVNQETETTKKPEAYAETLEKAEHQELLTAHAEQTKTAEKHKAESLAEARVEVKENVSKEDSPNPLEQLQAAEKASEPTASGYVDQQLKQVSLRRELQQIRRKLPAAQRALSRVIHQPVIRVVSQIADKTVSRPSGLLGGGIVAFLGTSGYLYLAKHLGIDYNYFVFTLLFAAGFLIGVAIELVVTAATANRRAHD